MTLWQTSTNPLFIQIGLTLAHSIWQGAILALLLLVALRFLRGRTPQSRYLACGLALGAMTFGPAATLLYIRAHWTAEMVPHAAPGLVTGSDARGGTPAAPAPSEAPVAGNPHPAAPPSLNAAITEPSSPAQDHAVAATRTPVAHSGAPAAAYDEGFSTLIQRFRSDDVLNRGLAWGAVLWLACVCVLAVRLSVGWTALRRWRACSQPLPEHLAEVVARMAERIGLAPTRLQVRVSEDRPGPSVFGLLRPVVLLPVSAVTQLPAELLEAMIAHELAHIRRYDLWVNVGQRVIETFLFYHPAVWWASSRMRLERELCCDDVAVKASGRRVEYAEALVALARRPGGVPALAAGMLGGRGVLMTRVRHVLQLPASADRRRAWAAGPLTILATLTLLLAPLSTRLVPGAAAQQQPAETPPVKAPRAHVAQPTFAFPETWAGTKIEHAFVLANTGDATLEIKAVKPSCGCTTAGQYDKIIAPGQEGRIPVVLNTTDFSGSVIKNIMVETNDPAQPSVRLTLRGTIKRRISIDPLFGAVWGTVTTPTPEPRKVKVTNNTEGPMKLEAVPSTQPSVFEASIQELQPGKAAEVTVRPKAPLKEGNYAEVLYFQTGVELEPKVKVNAMVRVTPTTQPAAGAMTGDIRSHAGANQETNFACLVPPDRKAQPGDLLQVAIYELERPGGWSSLMPVVNSHGAILLPRIGEVQVAGMNGESIWQKLFGAAKSAGIYGPGTTPPAGQVCVLGRYVPPPPITRTPVRTLASGVIAEIAVRPGQRVKKGELLVRLDDKEIELDLQAAMIKRDSMRLKLETGREAARDDLRLAELEIERCRLRLERTRIYSPIDGMVMPTEVTPPTISTPVGGPADAAWMIPTSGLDYDLNSMAGKGVTAGETLLMILSPAPVNALPASQPAGAKAPG